MPIQYRLFLNHLTTDDPDDYVAKVYPVATIGPKELAQEVVSMGSTVGLADITAVLLLASTAVRSNVVRGNRVRFGDVDIYSAMDGVMDSADDVFTPPRNSLLAKATCSKAFTEFLQANATVEKLEAIVPAPNITQVRDVSSGTINQKISNGGIVIVTGKRLQFNETQADEGIFLVNIATNAVTKMTLVAENLPSQLTFQAPTLATDANFRLEVRSRQSPGGQLRSGATTGSLQQVTPLPL